MNDMEKEDNNVTNEELIKRVENGDNSAWEMLCAKNEDYIKRIARNKAKRINHFPKDDNDDLIQNLCQAGWLGFLDAIKHYNQKKAKNTMFSTYAASWISGEMSKALDDYLNSTGVTGRVKYHQMIQSVSMDSSEKQEKIMNFICEDIESTFDFDLFITELKEKMNCTNQESYSETERAIQILTILKMMTDEKHELSKTQLKNCLEVYRIAADKNCTKIEGDSVRNATVQKILKALDPMEYTEDNDKDFVIKFKGYQDNRLHNNLENENEKCAEQKSNLITEENHSIKKKKYRPQITDLYFNHVFSYDELDMLIELVAFSDCMSDDEKLSLIDKIRGTASVYYTHPILTGCEKNRINYGERKIADRYTGKLKHVRKDMSHNLKVLQEAINRLSQVSFHFGQYDENGDFIVDSDYQHVISPYHIVVYHDQYYVIGTKKNDSNVWHFRIDLMNHVEILKDKNGKNVPIEIKHKEVMPSGIRGDEWNPEKYMSEHLYMSYDQPKDIQIKIRNTDYTILHDWFGTNYRKLHKKCEEGYDIVEVKTSPAMIVHWAMQYAGRVEIMNSDIRKRIREEIKSVADKYKE